MTMLGSVNVCLTQKVLDIVESIMSSERPELCDADTSAIKDKISANNDVKMISDFRAYEELKKFISFTIQKFMSSS